jgi:hypothetical protein
VDTNLLHKRFAHINPDSVSKLVDNTVQSQSIKMLPPIEDCEVCIKAKLTNKVYKKSTSQEVYNYLDKISSDVCGPFSKKTYNNYKYFITFLDKKTRFLEVALLKTKDEVFKAFYNFKARSENNS